MQRFGALVAPMYVNAAQRDRLHELSLTDELTRVANRRQFRQRLDAELKRTEREHHPVALVLFDLDDFKAINDRHGHPAGDATLRAFAEVLRRGARASDVVCRIGGEEFAVIAPSSDATAAGHLAHRILERTRAARLGPDGRLTASAGIASCPEHATTAEAMLRTADAGLLAAKRAGKDQVGSPM